MTDKTSHLMRSLASSAAADELKSILPRAYRPFLFPQVQQQIINDWLLWEISQYAEDEYPLLREISGWRRQEVINYCRSQSHIWDERIASMYGYPGSVM